jgi:hypothetical protein
MILNCLSKIDDLVFGGRKPIISAELEELCEVNNFDEIMEEWKNTINVMGEASATKMRLRMAHIRQMQYADDPKRVYNWLVRDATPMCEIDANVLEEFFNDRWSRGDSIEENDNFKLESTLTEEMRSKYIEDLLDLDKMKLTLRTRGNLSAPGLDGITNTILKIKRNSTAKTMIEVMKVLLNSGYCPSEWKCARTILIHKGNDRDDPGNWRPITITSVLYRVVFCRLVEGLHTVPEEEGINLCDREQKGLCLEEQVVLSMQQ